MRGWRVRAIYRAMALADQPSPYDRAHLKIYYPAHYSGTDEERNSGCIQPDMQRAPFPVIIFLPGINVSQSAYAWLARGLTAQGFACVLPTFIAEEMPGYISLSPGLDIEALRPALYGSRASAVLLQPIQLALQELNKEGILAGALDLTRVALGGHSAGGSVALLNACTSWLPGLRAVFSYGAHAAAAQALGYRTGEQFSLPAEVPTLVLGGDQDGCIAGSRQRYGLNEELGSATGMLENTFRRALIANRNDCHLGILAGANHFSIAWPQDSSTGRPFIDLPERRSGRVLRKHLFFAISRFLRGYLCSTPAALAALERQLHTPTRHWSLSARR